MSISTKLRKLQKMSAKEVRFRIGEKLRTFRERRLFNNRNSDIQDHSEVVNNLKEILSRFLPGTSSTQIETLKGSCPDEYRRISERAVTRADLVLSGNYLLLSQTVDLRDQFDWHRCPVTGHRWPKVFYADVPTEQSADNDLDVKFVWELGRQQYVVELAKGWFFSRDEKYARRALELITDWIESNPPLEGVNWASALEPSMRVISWIWCLALLSDFEGLSNQQTDLILSSLQDHGNFLENHLSYYSSPYNHLIGEATALFVLGTLFSRTSNGKCWETLGRKILEEYGPKQFYDDGFCVEQATGYHYYTLGFLAQAICVARQIGKPFGQLEAVTNKAYRCGKLFQRTDGLWPAIGDVDYARSIPVLHDDFFDFDSLNSLGAALFSDSLLKTNSEYCGEEIFWLLGAEGVEKWNLLDSKNIQQATILADSGYFIASDCKDWVCFDAGPVAAGLHADATPSTAHGHLDTLQILYCFDQNPVLDDLGMPFYFGPKEFVKHARGAAAHCSISIEGIPVAREAGRLAWSHVVSRPQLYSDSTHEFWNASAVLEFADGVTIERHLLAIPGEGLWIADRVSTLQARQVTWYWQTSNNEFKEIIVRDGGIERDSKTGFQFDSSVSNHCIEITENPLATASYSYGRPFQGSTITIVADCQHSLLMLTSIGRPDRRQINARHLKDGNSVGASTKNISSRSFRCQSIEWEIPLQHPAKVTEAVS